MAYANAAEPGAPTEAPPEDTETDVPPAGDDDKTPSPEPQAAETDTDAATQKQSDRRAREVERKRVYEERAEFKRRNEQLTQQLEKLAASVAAQSQNLEKVIPRPEDPEALAIKALQAKRRAAAERMGTDRNAFDEYHEAGDEINEMKADIRARRIVEEKERSRPAPPSNESQRAATEFPWLRENGPAREYAEAQIQRLAARERRDMTNPKVRYSTIREACAITARDWDLDPGYAPEANAAGRFAGSSGKSTGGGGGAISVTPNEDTEALAAALYPGDDPDVAWKKFQKNVILKYATGK